MRLPDLVVAEDASRRSVSRLTSPRSHAPVAVADLFRLSPFILFRCRPSTTVCSYYYCIILQVIIIIESSDVFGALMEFVTELQSTFSISRTA